MAGMKKFFTSLLLASAALLACAEEVNRNGLPDDAKIIKAPFMKEYWHQASPYNDLMPVCIPEADAGDTGFEGYKRRAPTGCVSTQMAQIMDYWKWPRYHRSFHSNTHNVAVEDKYAFQVLINSNGFVPFDYSNENLTPKKLSYLSASLGNINFNRNGSGGLPSDVIGNIKEEYVESPSSDTDWYTLKNMISAGFPIPATIEGHAVVLHGWAESKENGYYVFLNEGGRTKDRWAPLKEILTAFPYFHPYKTVQIDSLPAKSKLPLTVSWTFPEPYMTMCEKEFTGFRITATGRNSKGNPEVVVENVSREARSYTFDKLTNGEMFDIEITPIFSSWSDFSSDQPKSGIVTTTITDSDVVVPFVTAPKEFDAPLSTSSFDVECSESITKINIYSGLEKIIDGKTEYDLTKMFSVSNSDGKWKVVIDASTFPARCDDQNIVVTIEGLDDNQSKVYSETIVNFAAANKGTVPETGEGGDGEGTGSGTEGTDPKKLADYILISPKDFVEDWTEYVEKRKIAHPELTFVVKNAAEIYEKYDGDSPQAKIKSFIAEQAKLGAKYFVLGAAWSDISKMDGKSEESFIVTGQNGDKYGQEVLSLLNTIPGFTKTFSGKTLATDYPYALVDGDEKPDVVVARIPLVPWPKADGSVASFKEIIEGYGKKIDAAENAAFSGTHRYACAGVQLGTTVARGSEYWPTERHQYADGYYDFFDPRHPDSATDGMIAARRRFRDFFAMYNPIKGAMVIPLGKAATDFFDDKSGWEAVIAKCHGLEGEAHQTGITDARFRETSTLVKFGIFAMPCLTGRPDRTTTWNGWSNLRYPSMGVAAICNPNGGEVVGFHNTHDGAGENKVELVTTNRDAYATQYEGYLLTRLCKEHLNAGLAWKAAHEDYIEKQGTGTWHLWTAYESLLYGDPLVEMSAVNEPVCGPGKLPAKVLFR